MVEDLISVIIPTYKRSEFLFRSIDSVLSQTYKNIEVIVVDDNGCNTSFADETKLKICSVYGSDKRVRYIQNEENIGGAKARNYGAKCALGKYLCFLDDDDIYISDKLEKQHKFMVENELEMSFTDIKMYNEQDVLVDYRSHERYINSCDNRELLKKHIMYHLTPTDSYMFEVQAFWKAGGFHTRDVSQEFMLMLDAIEKGIKIGYMPGAYAVQYIHSEGRVSQSSRRVNGDKKLYEVKRQYFHLLNKKEIRFIRFRFYAALGVYFLRNRQYIKSAINMFCAFIISPRFFISEGRIVLKNRER